MKYFYAYVQHIICNFFVCVCKGLSFDYFKTSMDLQRLNENMFGFYCIFQEVPKTPDYAPSRTIYLFSVDLNQVARNLLERCYKVQSCQNKCLIIDSSRCLSVGLIHYFKEKCLTIIWNEKPTNHIKKCIHFNQT